MILSELAVSAAVEAGKSILNIYSGEFSVDFKVDESPLTVADSHAHKIISKLLAQSPYPVLSEEGRHIPYDERRGWLNYWLIDPLDGTKEFINRNGEFTVNIALIREKTPVLGIVYAPVKQLLYLGIEGEGAWKLQLESCQLPVDWKEACLKLPLKQENNVVYTVVGSRSHASKATGNYVTKLLSKHGDLEFISMGSSLKLCLVAEGRADVYPRLAPTMEWDTAAGDAIARAAGCKVVQYETGEPLQYNKENLLNPWFIVQR